MKEETGKFTNTVKNNENYKEKKKCELQQNLKRIGKVGKKCKLE